MKMKSIFKLGLKLSLLFLCGSCAANSVYTVPLVKLLIKPEEFEGTTVSVSGYLEFSPTLRLFLTKEHEKMNDIGSSIEIRDLTEDGVLSQSCVSHLVRIEGEFAKLYEGYTYGIKQVNKVYMLDDSKYCWNPDAESSNKNQMNEATIELFKRKAKEQQK